MSRPTSVAPDSSSSYYRSAGTPVTTPGGGSTPSPYAHLHTPGVGVTPYGNYPPPLPTPSSATPSAYGTAPWPQFQYYPPVAPATRIQSSQTVAGSQRPSFSTYAALSSGGNLSQVPNAPRARGKQSVRGLFAKELRNLMYGFGDDRNPANDTVNVMEEILIEYLLDICQTARPKGGRLTIDDLRRALSRPADAKKLARMEELLFMQEDIKRARAQFKDDDPSAPSAVGGRMEF